ncbi:Ig-like domain-containing protein [Deinococcus misasensis]|uniref:Ig-like domain-containing protein n=1 Tax=Deinococcus misasensis TaxID=392413 RepID=UPI00068D1FC3|nr:Ig-like domain-containing protein [Deinococcus misasensis]
MQHPVQFSRRLVLMGALLAPTLAACNSSTVNTPAEVKAVVVKPSSLTLQVGSSKPLEAQVDAPATMDHGVTWSTSNSAVVSVSNSGTLTALKTGQVTITATSKADPSKKGTSTVTVEQAPTSTVTAVQVTAPALEMQEGSSQVLKSTVTGQGNFDASVTWSSSNTAVATVNSTGMVQALKAGTVNIIATSKQNPAISAQLALKVLAAPADVFNITLVFPQGTLLTATQKQAFFDAAQRWSQVITAGLEDIDEFANGVRIKVDDVQITADAVNIDGVGKILGMAGPEYIRDSNGLPITGIMQFDSADMASMESKGTLKNVILHEMGHVLGIGTLWDAFLQHNGNPDCQSATSIVFTGTKAMQGYQKLGKSGPVPVENSGGAGTKCGHWSEGIFDSELMTGYAEAGTMPLSILTVGALADLGYQVNFGAADAYQIPNALQAPEKQQLGEQEVLLRPKGKL